MMSNIIENKTSGNNLNNFRVLYDNVNSLVIGDYLDILLNTDKYDHLYEHLCEVKSRKSKAILIAESDYKFSHIHSYSSYWKISNSDFKSMSRLKQLEYIIYREKDKKENDVKTADKPKKPGFFTGGILLPKKESHLLGSGNIVISGEPGVGKSTLAFQIAAACASDLNNGIAIYYSLDMHSEQLKNAMVAKDKGRINFCQDNYHINSLKSKDFNLENILKKENKEIIPQIIMPQLSPKGISPEGKEDRLFQERFDELEIVVKSAKKYNKTIDIELDKVSNNNEADLDEARKPKVKLIVIDSLNTFGEKKMKHEQIHRIFDLFRRNEIVGIFTLGMFEDNHLKDDTIDTTAALFLSDTLICLTKEQYENYSFNMLEIKKSRHVNHVRGKQIYKINNIDNSCRESIHCGCENSADKCTCNKIELKKELKVLPSLHHYIVSTDGIQKSAEDNPTPVNSKPEASECGKETTMFGIENFAEVLPGHFEWNKGNPRVSHIVSLVGDSGLYKSDIAIGSMISGMLHCDSSGLIIRMSDRDNLAYRGVRLSADVLSFYGHKYNNAKFPTEITFYETKITQYDDKAYKSDIKGWSLNKDGNGPQLLEIIFKSGALCPEEFVYRICKLIHQYNISRIAIMDLKLLSASYPVLLNSPTSGSMFLSAIIHIFRNYGIDVVITASSDNESKLCSQIGKLSDAQISVKRNKAGEVLVDGEGLVTKFGKETAKKKIFIDLIKDKYKQNEYLRYNILFKSSEEKDKEIPKAKPRALNGIEVFDVIDPAKPKKEWI